MLLYWSLVQHIGTEYAWCVCVIDDVSGKTDNYRSIHDQTSHVSAILYRSLSKCELLERL